MSSEKPVGTIRWNGDGDRFDDPEGILKAREARENVSIGA
jgi:hypothetical protein